MTSLDAFQEHVAMKFQLYNGLFLNLPFDDVKSSGILLPLFAPFCRKELEEGKDPRWIVTKFFADRLGITDEKLIIDELFRFMRLVERQVVLFDALEDAAFLKTHDIHGPGSVKDLLNRIVREEQEAAYREFVEDYRVRVVLTAHPTQFYTDEVLTILTDLSDGLERNSLREINDLLLQMGQTRFKNREKPTPLEEAKGMMWILEQIMYEAVPDINRRLIEELDVEDDRAIKMPGILELGFWPGGDRDGNPFVTADLTIQVGELLRSSILNRYLDDLRRLKRRLTFTGTIDKIEQIESRLVATLHPYSLVPVQADQGSYCFDEVEGGYKTADDFLQDLIFVHQDVLSEHRGLFAEKLEDLIFKVRSFGFHFASLDIRQDSRIHTATVATLLDLLADSTKAVSAGQVYNLADSPERSRILLDALEHFSQLSAKERSAFRAELLRALSEEPVRADTIRSLEALRLIQQRNGIQGAHRYVISNSQGAFNVLEVYLLAAVSGLNPEQLGIDIVPLFETIPDLHNAEEIMEELYANELYAAHLETRKNRQTIMLGFSDGTKDGGYVTANWEIYQAKERLTAASRRQGIRVEFFDGRGGPPARGGGNTHKFYRSLSPEIESRSLQLTIQGQTISSLYGTPESARYNLEQLVTAGIENNLFPSDHHLMSSAERKLMEELSDRALACYRNLKRDPAFVAYLEEMTPLNYYGKTNIGSRPTKRSTGKAMEFSDLRAIPFVGAWSQNKQNLPGFYGFGTALSELFKEGHREQLQELYRENLFFRTLIENSMQSLSKAYFPLTKYHQDHERYGEFWKGLQEESVRTTINLLKVSNQGALLSTEPKVKESIALRESMILPSLVIQQYALARIRELIDGRTENGESSAEPPAGEPPSPEVYEKLILKGLAASINASRNAV